MKTLIYICEDCKHENKYNHDGRHRVLDSIWIHCQNSKCERFLKSRKMWLKKDVAPVVYNALQQKIISETLAWYALGCETYNLTHDDLTITFNKRGAVAGTAWSSKRLIEYNLILAQENQIDFINQIVPHEVAHIIANRYFKKNCGHKKEWKAIMVRFGLSATRCHNYNVQNAERQRFKYTCACGSNFQVGKNLHNKLQNGSGHYCRKCKTKLIYIKD